MNKIIFAFTAIVSVMATNMALGVTTVVDCISCTDPRTGTCTSYGSGCCSPCKVGGSDVDPSEFPTGCAKCQYWDWTTLSVLSTSSTKKYYQTMCVKYIDLQGNATGGTCWYRCPSGYYGTGLSASNLGACSKCPTAPDIEVVYKAVSNPYPYAPITPTVTNSVNSTSGASLASSGTNVTTSGTIYPSSITLNPVTSNAGSNTTITDCYIPDGTYKDSTGYFTFTTDCPYTN